MAGNVLRFTDRPSSADSPLPSSKGAVNCVHSPAHCWTCILIRTNILSCTQCSVHWSPFMTYFVVFLISFLLLSYRSPACIKLHMNLLPMVVSDEFAVSVTTWKSVCSAVPCRHRSALEEFRDSKCCKQLEPNNVNFLHKLINLTNFVHLTTCNVFGNYMRLPNNKA